MIDNKVGSDWQKKFRNLFESKDLIVVPLDKKSKNRRCVDFWVHKKIDYQEGFLCEVKSVNVVGFDEEIKAQISSRDNKFWGSVGKNVREHNYDHYGVESKVRERLIDALSQYEDSYLSRFKIVKEGKPFVVAIGFDFTAFPNQVNFSQLLQEFPLVSAVLTLEGNDMETFKVYTNKISKISFRSACFLN
ncbi:MAG TPA: hypothetical protein VMY36_03825 [Patescibacteria group bacterium]|nr:hypothetical protein [Patescibacteria group bacterium]